MIYSSDDDDDENAAAANRMRTRLAEAMAEQTTLEERNNMEIKELTAKIEDIDQKLKKLEAKFKDKKLEFNGYRNLKPLERYTPDGSRLANDETNSELKKVGLI